ncbi:uncharacterized protein AMSG_07026 [Thecamonas trahens ATCC 50062]|uniref:ABC3 transporter permease C-terminal domain-containing protein n=1 Tax=Thecamonas trahens ATCC 50062 TaxID=461836 RepID=A0A0L0DFN1_THETB|nr:hypothetical protein AMSG_07026 [Thecamonas trahens ATCC 50062]KNC51045.1 hypothetical protein AMSG_07026 [Thecamonas trahens ATCC 50062]|eukprot:XP_013756510.1 hypothetical protein AMSG_07026 [Thecamonas trahens ATCC 50062]
MASSSRWSSGSWSPKTPPEPMAGISRVKMAERSSSASGPSSRSLPPAYTGHAVQEGWSEGNQTLVGDAATALKYLWAATRKEKRNWMVGVFTVALVVFFVTVLRNNVERSPLIFWRLAELSAGETDALLTPTSSARSARPGESPLLDPAMSDGVPLVNFTHIRQQWEEFRNLHGESALVSSIVPRWYLLGRVRNRDVPTRVSSAIFVVYDSHKELAAGIGRNFNHRALGEAETHVSSPLLRTLGLGANRGDRILLSLEADQLLPLLNVESVGFNLDLLAQLLNNPIGLLAGAPGVAVETGDVDVDVNTTVNTGDTVDFGQNTLLPFLSGLGLNTSVLTPQVLDGLLGPVANQSVPVAAQLAAAGLQLSLADLVPGLDVLSGLDTGATSPDGDNSTNIGLSWDYAVIDDIQSPGGKFPDALGNVVLIDSHQFEKVLLAQIRELIANPLVVLGLQALETQAGLTVPIVDTITDFLADFRMEDYALTVAANYRARETAYVKTTDEGLKTEMAYFANEIYGLVGYNSSVDIELPIYLALEGTEIIRLFLDQIFNSVVFVISLLSALLIYSLMLSNVEEKTFEYGMLRALGMRQHALIFLLVVQALSFAIPGIIIGWAVAFVVDLIPAWLIAEFSDTDARYGINPTPLYLSLAIGLIVPLLANWVPIRRALSSTLRNALDVYHQTNSETVVRVIKLESLGLSGWQTALAVTLVGVGFVTYYMIPYAFTYNDFGLLLTILNGILLGIVLGLAMVAQVLQPYTEWAFLWSMVWGTETRLAPLIRKNLGGHRSRNRKTALMFTTSLAFLIFAGSLFALQEALIKDLIAGFFGSDIAVLSFAWEHMLNEDALRDFLDDNLGTLVASFSFGTQSIDLSDLMSKSRMSSIVDFPRVSQPLHAIDANWLQTAYTKYYIPTEVAEGFDYAQTSNGKDDVAASLYTHAGTARLSIEPARISVPLPLGSGYDSNRGAVNRSAELELSYTQYFDTIVSESLRDRVSLDVDTPQALTLRYDVSESATVSYKRLGKARAMVRKFPGFFVSSYRQFAPFNPILIRFDQYAEALERAYNLTSLQSKLPQPERGVAPKGSLIVRMSTGASTEDRESIVNGMRNFIQNDLIQVIDVVELIKSTSIATEMLQLFFIIVSVITSLLCFFVLFLSFTANVNENSWEIGVLRALGLSSAQALRVYIYEALSLTLASMVMGTIIGLLTAVALTLQMGLFTESPFVFQFPTLLFCVVVVLSIGVTLIGSWLPARSIMGKEIAIVLKEA